jgi:hypothetical protein
MYPVIDEDSILWDTHDVGDVSNTWEKLGVLNERTADGA